jgi:hypothetical protein
MAGRLQHAPIANFYQGYDRVKQFCFDPAGQSLAIYSNHSHDNVRFNLTGPGIDKGSSPCLLAHSPIIVPSSSKEDSPYKDPKIVEETLYANQLSSASTGPSKQKKEELEKIIKKIEDSSAYKEQIKQFLSSDWSSVSRREFIQLATGELFSSVAMQGYIWSFQVPEAFENLATETAHVLIFDQYGCQVVRKLIKKSKSTLDFLCHEINSNNFAKLCVHSYASKVLQTLAEQNEGFRVTCLELFVVEWDRIKRSICSNYLLTICLKNTDPHELVFRQVGEAILSKSDNNLRDKYTKRFLVNYVEYCSFSQLASIYKHIHMEKALSNKSKDRYVVFIFMSFVRRGLKRAEDHLLWVLSQSKKDNTILLRMVPEVVRVARPSFSRELADLFQQTAKL